MPTGVLHGPRENARVRCSRWGDILPHPAEKCQRSRARRGSLGGRDKRGKAPGDENPMRGAQASPGGGFPGWNGGGGPRLASGGVHPRRPARRDEPGGSRALFFFLVGGGESPYHEPRTARRAILPRSPTPPPLPRGPVMKSSRWLRIVRKVVLLLLAVGLLGGAGWGVWHWRTSGNGGPGFKTEPATRGKLVALINASGTTVPEEVVDVGAQVAGQILEFGRDLDDSRKPI